MRFYVETFGCQMNAADSQEIARRLRARGFERAASAGEADVLVVNTCTVRQHAEQRALSRLGRLKDWRSADPGRMLVLAGCAAERLGEGVRKRFPQVGLVVGARSLDRFEAALEARWPRAFGEAPAEWDGEWGWGPGASGPESGFVTIMRGCDFACAYCIVPSVRGPERCRPARSILGEAAAKARAGAGEITLLGQTVNAYRAPGGESETGGLAVRGFADLLAAVSRIEGVRWARFMSPHPAHVGEDLARTYAECPAVAPHIHLPAQSGSDAVLKRMRRGHRRRDYLDRLALLRRARPGLAVTTDFIVGFPGESEADFKDSLSLADEAGLDGAYLFAYSPRPGTPAAALPDDVPEGVKAERRARLQEAVDRGGRRLRASLIGTDQEVRLEAGRREKEGWVWEGRTAHNRILLAKAREAPVPGRRLRMRVTKVEGKTLWGEPALAADR